MATKMNGGKKLKEMYNEANAYCENAIIAKNREDGKPIIVDGKKARKAISKASEAIGAHEYAEPMLEKDSTKRKEYRERCNELENKRNQLSDFE